MKVKNWIKHPANEKQLLEYLKKIRSGKILQNTEYWYAKYGYPKLTMQLDNDERIAYMKKGNGKNTVILVHGNMSSGVHYMPLLEKLPKDFTAYVPDLRGFGDSTYHTRINKLEDFADDLYKFIDKLDLSNFTLVGWSTGGGVCLSFEAKYPGKCKNIVLIDSVAANGYAIYQHDIFGREIEGLIYQSKSEMMRDPYHAWLMYNIMAKNYPFMNAIWMERIYTVKKPTTVKNIIYLTESLKQRNIIDVEWALATFNMTSSKNAYVDGDSSIDKVNVPVLCTRGRQDKVVTADMVKLTASAIGKNAKSVEFDGCGHSPFVDCPNQLAERLFKFSKDAV